MFIPLFGPERELHDPPDAAEPVEEVILTMIERSKRLDVTMATSPPPGPRAGRRSLAAYAARNSRYPGRHRVG